MPEYDDKRLKPPTGSGDLCQVVLPSAGVFEAPADTARLATEALCGEYVRVFEEQGDLALVQCLRDHYVGWIPVHGISSSVSAPTHKVCTPLTHGYTSPDLKSPPVGLFSLGARVCVVGQEGDWRNCGIAGWIHARHLTTIDDIQRDPVDMAERLVGAPYLWGGRKSTGLDCTGLTQQCFETAGILLPRDSDMQFDWSGITIDDWQTPGTLRRGDLVFWKGHVGIMADETHLIHSNAWHMATAKEPLEGAITRIANYYAEPIGARRLDFSSEAGRDPDWKCRLGG